MNKNINTNGYLAVLLLQPVENSWLAQLQRTKLFIKGSSLLKPKGF